MKDVVALLQQEIDKSYFKKKASLPEVIIREELEGGRSLELFVDATFDTLGKRFQKDDDVLLTSIATTLGRYILDEIIFKSYGNKFDDFKAHLKIGLWFIEGMYRAGRVEVKRGDLTLSEIKEMKKSDKISAELRQIGRASCRERV